jgi:hypothetical protein
MEFEGIRKTRFVGETLLHLLETMFSEPVTKGRQNIISSILSADGSEKQKKQFKMMRISV